ncbi:MAG TPA: hypothetical protein VK191_17665 [Symbiobacteriaceae bacterium]|nr:hypothetical protein [Symbiobacteriaceae bacterium]
MSMELKLLLDALLEGQKVLSAKLDAVDSRLSTSEAKLDAVATDVATIKGQLIQLNSRDEFALHRLIEVEADVHDLKKKSQSTP